jgi:predicted nuclease of predicted toxin-antitoxin system
MKLLLDQGLPRMAAELLRAFGFDTLHIGEIGYATATDAAILQLALGEQRIVVTLDADFHALLALSAAPAPSVIRIRIEGLRAQALAALIQAVIAQCEEELAQGAVVTVQDARLRVRRLPLV